MLEELNELSSHKLGKGDPIAASLVQDVVVLSSDSDVVQLSSDSGDLEDELADTADSSIRAQSDPPTPPPADSPPPPQEASPITVGLKVPRVHIHSRNRCFRLRDEVDEDDYIYIK